MAANLDSKECAEVLALLATSHNVLISGPPGTGKTRLLSEVANAFTRGVVTNAPATVAMHDPNNTIAIPAEAPTANANAGTPVVPAPGQTNRQVFRTVFHQSSKYREFVSGIAPRLGQTLHQVLLR